MNISNGELDRIEKTLLENDDGSQSYEDSYYVYMLAIKNDEFIEPFYIGKGIGKRVFAHENDAEKVVLTIEQCRDEGKLGDEIAEKIKMIISSKENGQDIVKYIVKWGLTSYEALMCESALINLYDRLYPNKLTNIVNGHASKKERNSKTHTTRVYEISEFLKEVCIEKINYEDSDLMKYPVMFIQVKDALAQYDIDKSEENKLIDYEQYVYESTQGYWKYDIKKANNAKYVIALQNTIVRGIYRIDKWMKAKDLRECTNAPHYPLSFRNNDNLNKDIKFLNRIGFVKKEEELMSDDERDELDELKKQLLNKIIKEKTASKKDWFKEQYSTYNYDVSGKSVYIRQSLRKFR